MHIYGAGGRVLYAFICVVFSLLEAVDVLRGLSLRPIERGLRDCWDFDWSLKNLDSDESWDFTEPSMCCGILDLEMTCSTKLGQCLEIGRAHV
jgi:hypothetical protein